MLTATLHLKVLLPFQVFMEKSGVSRIVVETHAGSYGLLPHRLDCVAALSPGIWTYETESEGEVYIAVDEGVMVKVGTDIIVSVRRALRGPHLSELRESVQQEYQTLNEQEQNMRSVTAKLEAGFIRRFAGFQNE